MRENTKELVGYRIRSIRQNLGLSMKEFGKLFTPEASDSIVSRWERGVSLPNNTRLKKIAELGNVSVDYLLNGSTKLINAYVSLISDDAKKNISSFKSSNLYKELLTRDINFESNKNNENLTEDLNLLNNYFSKIPNKEIKVNSLELKFLVESILLINDIRDIDISDEQQIHIYSSLTDSLKQIRNDLTP